MSVAAILALVSGVLGMSGIVTTIERFDPDSPWFALGLLAIGVGAVGALTSLVVSHRTRILRAFDVGYKAGFDKGRRIGRPVVVPLPEGGE